MSSGEEIICPPPAKSGPGNSSCNVSSGNLGFLSSATEQHDRQARGQQQRLFLIAIVIGNELDRALVQLVEQYARKWRQPRLGIAHCRRVIAVARPEVALTIDQRVAQGKVLRHALY